MTQKQLDRLRLIQMHALTGILALDDYRVRHHEDYISIKNFDNSGWIFRADEYADDPSYQTLLLINEIYTEYPSGGDTLNTPDKIAVA